MRPPIFVYEPGTMYVFSSKERAEAHLEADIVVEYGFTAYDSEGYQLELAITPDRWVEIRSMTPPVNKTDEFIVLLRDFLRVFDSISDEWLANASLDELTTKALEYETEVLTWSEFVSKQVKRLRKVFFARR